MLNHPTVVIGAALALALGLGLGQFSGPPQARLQTAAQPNPLTRPAPGVLLVAAREMPDPRFRRSVILLLAHNGEGTVGVIVNRPTDIRLADAVPDLDHAEQAKHRLYFGGPVAMNTLLFLVRGQAAAPGQSKRVLADIYMSADRVTLEHVLGRGQPADKLRIYFGHAGWAPGQLEAELASGSWELFQAEPEAVFSQDPQGLWETFMGPARPLMVRRRGLPRAAGGQRAANPSRPLSSAVML